MSLTREARGRGVDVRAPEMLGTLATRPPLIEDFQFVKFRVEGEVAHLRLDRPDQNLLNERMLMEMAAGINFGQREAPGQAECCWIRRARLFPAELSWANIRSGACFSCWMLFTARLPR